MASVLKRARAGMSLFDQSFELELIRGETLSLASLRGKALLIVNTASH